MPDPAIPPSTPPRPTDKPAPAPPPAKTKTVRMLKLACGPDGTFEAGKTYTLSIFTADQFIKFGSAEPA